MENTTAYGTSLDIVYENTIVWLLNEIEKNQDQPVIEKGLSATVLIMTYSLVEAKMWSAIKRLTNSDRDLNQDKLDFLSNNRNWLFEKRKDFLNDEYGIDIEELDEYRSVSHLGNLRNVVAHGGSINVERSNTDDNFKFSKDSFRKALVHYNGTYQSHFSDKSIIDDSTVEVITQQFLSLEFVNFYFSKIELFISAFEVVILEKINSLTSATSTEHASQ